MTIKEKFIEACKKAIEAYDLDIKEDADIIKRKAMVSLDGEEMGDFDVESINLVSAVEEVEEDAADQEAVERAVSNLLKKEVNSAVVKAAGKIEVLGERKPENDKTNGWKSFGEFAKAVAKAGPGASIKAPTSYSQTQVGADGGFLIPEEFGNQIMAHAFSDQSIIGRTSQINISANSYVVPSDETTPWGSNGVQVEWTAEAAQISQSKPNLKRNTINVHKIAALVPVTEEQLEDSPQSMEQYVTNAVAPKMDYKLSDAIINGSGAGKPEGFLNSGALVTVAKETSQTADTINVTNIRKMFARMHTQYLPNAIWGVNPDCWEQLLSLEDSAGRSLVTAPGTLQEAPYGAIYGRPIVPHEAFKTLGDAGDICLFDPSQYLSIIKGGIKSAASMHLFFDYDMQAFRFTIRVGGQPWASAPITPPNSSATKSAFVALADRA